MDAALKELEKLGALTAPGGARTSKSAPIDGTLDALLATLTDARARVAAGDTDAAADLAALPARVDQAKKDVDARLQETYTALTRYGKALDKKFADALPAPPAPLFVSPGAHAALEHAIALHLLRTGRPAAAQTFAAESPALSPAATAHLEPALARLHAITAALRAGDPGPALAWAAAAPAPALAFRLHRFAYLRLLASPAGARAARDYAAAHLAPRHAAHPHAVARLLGALAYAGRLGASPYADLFAHDGAPGPVCAAFSAAYTRALGLGARAPLGVAANIGGGGALARIEKGRKLMRERKSEWGQQDELPIEVPLRAEDRFHSVFACPVSKDQASEANPPMMLVCGHVVAKESLAKLGKANGKVKCPYCPAESYVKNAVRMYF